MYLFKRKLMVFKFSEKAVNKKAPPKQGFQKKIIPINRGCPICLIVLAFQYTTKRWLPSNQKRHTIP